MRIKRRVRTRTLVSKDEKMGENNASRVNMRKWVRTRTWKLKMRSLRGMRMMRRLRSGAIIPQWGRSWVFIHCCQRRCKGKRRS